MPSKQQMITELAMLTASDISSHPNLYPSFLTTAANNYKYNFRDQLLIYAQKPDATACADVETWNKLGRWVNKGTKGIALLVDRDVPYKLRHVFDISNTNSFRGYEVKTWQMARKYEETVLDDLENSYGEIEHREHFSSALLEIAKLVVQDNYTDYLEKLIASKSGSYLEDLDDFNIEVYFKELLNNGVAYMMLSRCGYDTENFFETDDFREITNFNTPETVNVLGCATSDIGEMVLREIEATVRSAEKDEKTHNRTFAEKPIIEHNNGEKKNTERSNDYDSDLQASGRLSTPEPEHSGKPDNREIWNVATHLPPRVSENGTQRNATDRQTEQSFRGSGQESHRDDGISDETDGERAESDREVEIRESDALGTDEEQYPNLRGGNRADGSGLRLSGHDYNGRQEKDYYHSDSEKAELIRNCIHLKDHRAEIATFFAEHENRDERGNFIKSYFDGDSVSHILKNGQKVGYRAFDDLVQIWHGDYDTRDKEDFIQWRRLADHINGQMLLHEWLSEDEKPIPGESEQISFVAEQEKKKAEAFVLPQDAIDYVLTGGSGVSEGKFRIYEKFLRKDGKESNIAFLKDEYGTGGHSDAIPGSGLWESHDAKGITIATLGVGKDAEKKSYLITWSAAEKRIGELITVGRYLNSAEKEKYPSYHKKQEERTQRDIIAQEFRSVITDFNDYEDQLDEKSKLVDRFVMSECANAFVQGEKDCGFGTEKHYTLPTMREMLSKVISENTHLTERAEKVLEQLGSEIAYPLEPTYDELNPPPEPEKEYKFSLGDTVFIGTHEYEILSLDGDTVQLFDSEFPLFTQEMPKAEFEAKAKENPLNDKYLVAVEPPTEKPVENAVDNTVDRITVDRDAEQVKWIYYNPDSTAGGSYICCELDFDVFEEALAEHLKDGHIDDIQKFVGEIEGMSDQYWSDRDTFDFENTEADYFAECDYEGFSEDTVQFIHEDIEKYNASKVRIDAGKSNEPYVLDRVLKALKIFDIRIDYDVEGNLVAKDEDNQWVNKQFYEFLVEDAISYDEYGKPIGFPDELVKDFSELAAKYGVEVKDYYAPTPFDEYEKVKKENPDAVVIQKIGDFFEMFGEEDTRIAHEVLDLTVTKREFTNKSITTPMCGFPYHKTEEYVQKLLDAGHDVVAVTHDKGEKLEVRRIVSSAKEKVQEAPTEELAPPTVKRKEKVTPHILFPDIKSEYRTNFTIEDDNIGVGTPLERFYNNIHAIQLLNKLESEHRLADTNEQRVLSQYVGWGGLSEFFKEDNPHYDELKSILSEDEYASARESTLTAFYTPPTVIKAIYKALENMGFKNGNVLEPSCGVGNFMGLVPASMSDAKFYGVELDKISGRIAQQLYQKNSIAVQGFEETSLPDSFFDAAVGNVPFGQFKVPDKRYDKYNFLIHDYFFARTLDKVRPGGVVAFITSRGTMDKENPAVRKYIDQRAELLGAIRLPNNTFKDAAGTEVTADILFLQKRDRLIDMNSDWVHLNTDENGIKMNPYFIDNPEMILGDMKLISSAHGMEPACIAYENADLSEQLNDAIQNIHAEVNEVELDDLVDEEEDFSIPADPDVRNFSYTVVDGKIYYRENSRMNPVDVSMTAENRIKGMIGIRDCVRTLIDYQTEDYPDEAIKEQQTKLNELYDAFSKKYGLINSRANSSAFNSDSSYCLLSSLEILDDEGQFIRKADMFSKRTIKQKVIVTSVDTASEALALSLAEKTMVDMAYMSELTGKTEQEIFEDLKGVIFLNPAHISENDGHPKYLPADEYLSGNVREKLAIAKKSAELYPEDYTVNVEALQKVMPKDLSASEISVRLGATWLPPEDIEKFMFELFDTVRYLQWNIKVHYSEYTGEWNIEGKSYDRSNIKAYNTFGTSRINGYKIMEETLNLKDVRIFDYIEDEHGNKKPVLNKKETAIAQGKQQLIKEAFAEWIWKVPERRERLTKLYNEKFNSVRPREYNGEHLNFVGINPEIKLREHQVNAIAHILYGGNTLLAHVVGAGKTFEMVAAAQESKRLGLCQKSLFVVPNHLTEQWAAEYLQLYPSANILVATKKDFETKNRKKFCGRVATGDYDAIIIGHSQFEKIPMSVERQRMILEQQLDEILDGIAELKKNRGDSFSIKQFEKTKKTVQQKLDKLNDQSRKDDVVTFEELGVDRIFIDEAHYYKNLAAFTKMRNVGGISQTEAMKSSDLYMKCRYLDELTGGKGVVFATGTPISNSMVELYTMQKYLQYRTLRNNNLLHFDAWASTFGETVTAIELAPEGTGYRAKTRFAKFYNLPELMAMFKETADIQTADMLHLPVPEAHYHNVALKPSEQQKEMVKALSERAEKVRNKMVNSSEDNMLLITNDGRKLALDQRMVNEMLPDSETSKVSACADNVFEIWERTKPESSTQMVFCDLSTPHGDDKFNVYDDLRDKLIAKGIPAEEIAYIHSANTEVAKKELFGKVRNGQIRVLIGSTQKMGAGTNVQKKLIALHHLDCPWRPSDLQQREGRIVRQGNENPEVDIYTYVTENTFDSYLYQLVESKQKFIGQIMTSKSPVRSAEDVDEQALSYAEIKALCTGNPYIKEKMDLDIDVSRLKLLKANHLSQKYSLEDKILKEFPQRIVALEQRIAELDIDMETVKEHPVGDSDAFCGMTVKGIEYTEKKEAGEAILAACKAMTKPDAIPLGSYRGFDMELNFDAFSREYQITLKGKIRHTTALGTDVFGNILRLDNMLEKLPEKKEKCIEQLGDIRNQLANAKVEVEKPFPHEEELKTKSERLAELNSLLDMDKKENEIVEEDRDDGEEKEQERTVDRDAR